MYYCPSNPEVWARHLWSGERVKALCLAMPGLFSPTSPEYSSLLVASLVATCGEKYIAGRVVAPDAMERLSVGFQGDVDDAATVLNELAWCKGMPAALSLEARDPCMRTFFSCRGRFDFIAAVIIAGKTRVALSLAAADAAADAIPKKACVEEWSESAAVNHHSLMLMDPRICSRGGGVRVTSPYAAAIASFL